MFSGGDAAKPLKVALSASADGQPRCWEAGLVGMRKGGVRYVAVTAAAVAAEVHLGRGEAGPGGARLYRLEVLKMKRGDTSKEAASSSAPDAVVATEGAEVPHDPATSPLPTSTPPTPTKRFLLKLAIPMTSCGTTCPTDTRYTRARTWCNTRGLRGAARGVFGAFWTSGY